MSFPWESIGRGVGLSRSTIPQGFSLGGCFFGTVFEIREKLLEKMAYLSNEQKLFIILQQF
jgi:hypothetical protein